MYEKAAPQLRLNLLSQEDPHLPGIFPAAWWCWGQWGDGDTFFFSSSCAGIRLRGCCLNPTSRTWWLFCHRLLFPGKYKGENLT